MTDDRTDHRRAEQAFRNAFAQHAVEAPRAVPGHTARPRSWWRPLAVAAVVLLVLGGTSIAALQLSDGDHTGRRIPDVAAPGGDLPAPDQGWRWVSWHDVAVQVPEGWAVGFEPGADWCANGGGTHPAPREPYVAINGAGMIHFNILCNHDPFPWPKAFGEAPEGYWAPHLTFVAAGSPEAVPEGTETYDGWQSVVTTLGDVQLRVLGNAGSASTTRRIIDSILTYETDQNGCDATSPVQAAEFVRPAPAFDVASVEAVDSASVCMYDRQGTGRPGLTGSRLLTGDEAVGLLHGIQQAPAGGGPNPASHCMRDDYGDSAIVVLLHAGETTRTLYVYYASCFGNGFDDGTQVRALTRDSCPLLWGGSVRLLAGDGAVFRRCA